MLLDARTLELLVIVVAFAASTAFLWRSQSPFWRRLRRLLSEGDGGGLDAIAVDLEQADRLGVRVDALNALQRDPETAGQPATQRVGVVRFNPFTGGDQAFAGALLDALGNRLVVCSLHGRADTRIFAKQVRGGRSRHQLSTKEEDAIRQALTPQQA